MLLNDHKFLNLFMTYGSSYMLKIITFFLTNLTIERISAEENYG